MIRKSFVSESQSTANRPELRAWRERVIYIFLILLLILLPALKAEAWSYTEFSFDADTRIAMMAGIGEWNPYVELKTRFHGDEERFRYGSFTAGSYYRAAPWLKLGAFYRLEMGARSIEDWQVALPDNHSWDESAGRIENLLLLDATPRFLLPFIPGKNWVAPVKFRYSYNLSNSHHSLLIRPGISYVVMKERAPVVNLTLSYNFYFALNYGEVPLYSHGPYFTVLGHINDWLKLEGRLRYTTNNYLRYEFGGSWSLKSTHLAVGIGVIFMPIF